MMVILMLMEDMMMRFSDSITQWFYCAVACKIFSPLNAKQLEQYDLATITYVGSLYRDRENESTSNARQMCNPPFEEIR